MKRLFGMNFLGSRLGAIYVGLDHRQKKIIAIVLALSVSLLLIVYGLLPAHQYVKSASGDLRSEKQLSRWLTAYRPVVEKARGFNGTKTDLSADLIFDHLQVIANDQGFGLLLQGEPRAVDTGTAITFKLLRVPYDKVLAWVSQLEKERAFEVDNITLERSVSEKTGKLDEMTGAVENLIDSTITVRYQAL